LAKSTEETTALASAPWQFLRLMAASTNPTPAVVALVRHLWRIKGKDLTALPRYNS